MKKIILFCLLTLFLFACSQKVNYKFFSPEEKQKFSEEYNVTETEDKLEGIKRFAISSKVYDKSFEIKEWAGGIHTDKENNTYYGLEQSTTTIDTSVYIVLEKKKDKVNLYLVHSVYDKRSFENANAKKWSDEILGAKLYLDKEKFELNIVLKDEESSPLHYSRVYLLKDVTKIITKIINSKEVAIRISYKNSVGNFDTDYYFTNQNFYDIQRFYREYIK